MTRDLDDRKTLLLPANQPHALRQAADSLRDGGLVAFPTDTVYGLGALVWNEASIERIYTAKERPPEKAIPILLANLSEAHRLVGAGPETAGEDFHRCRPSHCQQVSLGKAGQ